MASTFAKVSPDELWRRRYEVTRDSRFYATARRLRRTLERAVQLIDELSDLDRASVLSAWERAGIGVGHQDGESLLEDVSTLVQDANGARWTLEMLVGLLESDTFCTDE